MINDPDLIPSLSIQNKLKQAVLEAKDSESKLKAFKALDPNYFECFLASETIARIKYAWGILCQANPNLSIPIWEDGSFSQSRVENDSNAGGGGGISRGIPWSHIRVGLQESSILSQHSSTSLFQNSIDLTAFPAVGENNALRLSSVGQNENDGLQAGMMAASRKWTPHELTLQRVVQKRGGELFVITAASTKGRMNIPRRRPKYQRLETDIERMGEYNNLLVMTWEDLLVKRSMLMERITQQHENPQSPSSNDSPTRDEENLAILSKKILHFEESIREANLRHKILILQRNFFRNVTSGNMQDFKKQVEMKELQDGQTLLADEQISLDVEYKMARRIELFIRKITYKIMLQKLMALRHIAASKIQTIFRSNRGKKAFADSVFAIKQRMLLRIVRETLIGKTRMITLKKKHKEKLAAKLIQRIWRGVLGRNRIRQKRIFLREIKNVQDSVSLNSLTTGDIQEVIEVIEPYLTNFLLVIPVEIMTVIRGLFFVLNGDEPESITVIEDDQPILREVFAEKLTWMDAIRLMRRKGKLLRRLRMLARLVQVPESSPLTLSESCVKHLEDVVKIDTKMFKDVKCKEAIGLLHTFLVAVKAIHDRQDLFPEYFGAGQQSWLRELLEHRLNYEKMRMEKQSATFCLEHLEKMKLVRVSQGLKWGVVTEAIDVAKESIAKAELGMIDADRRMKYFVARLVKLETQKLHGLESVLKTGEVGLDVAKRETAAYFATTEYPEEKMINGFYNRIDQMTIANLFVKSDIIETTIQMERDVNTRDFDSFFNFEIIIEWCGELGTKISDILMLKGEWRLFIEEIGGMQFVADIVGNKLSEFKILKSKILNAIEERRKLSTQIDVELKRQIVHVKQVIADNRTAVYKLRQNWDCPFPVVVQAEKEEDYRAATRDAEAINRKAKQPNFFAISPKSGFPSLLIADAKMPKKTRKLLKDELFKYNFTNALTLRNDKYSEITPKIQQAMDEGRSTILYVDRGFDEITRSKFNNRFLILLNAIYPRPKVLALDANLSLTSISWCSELSPSQECFATESSSDVNPPVSLLIAKIRRIEGLMRHSLEVGYGGIHTNSPFSFIPDWLPRAFVEDQKNFVQVLEHTKTKPSDKDLSKDQVSSISQQWTHHMTGHAPVHIVLAATVSALLELWKPPVSQWTGFDFRTGLDAFLRLYSNIHKFLDAIRFNELPATKPLSWARIAPVMSLTQVWHELSNISIYSNPIVFSLTQWARTASDYMYQTCRNIEAVTFAHLPDIIYSRELSWEHDIMSTHFDAAIGDILHVSLQGNLIYQDEACPIQKYVTNGNFESHPSQLVKLETIKCPVYVYQSGYELFVEVVISKENTSNDKTMFGGTSAKNVSNIKRYFNRLTTKQFIQLLQPNSTEIFEVRPPKYNLDDSFHWQKYVAEYTRIKYHTVDNENKHYSRNSEVVVHTTRAKYLQMTLLGMIDGHKCRLEIFEECFGQITVLLHGIYSSAMEFTIDDDKYKALMSRCDPDEERSALEKYEAYQICAIIADRIQIKPSARMCRFLDQSLSSNLYTRIVNPIRLAKKAHIRIAGGGGRLVGLRIYEVAGTTIVLRLFELHTASDSHSLRIQLYEPTSAQTVEYKVSSMERTALFKHESPVIEQIFGKLRLVQVVKDNSFPLAVVYLNINRADFRSHLSNVADDKYDIVLPEALSVKEGVTRFVTNPDEDVKTYFAVIFDRSIIREKFNNIEVGLSLSYPLGGFLCTVYNLNNFLMVHRVINYRQASAIFVGKDYDSLLEEIDLIDGSDAVLDLVEDLSEHLEMCDDEEQSEQESEQMSDDESEEGEDDNDDDDRKEFKDKSKNNKNDQVNSHSDEESEVGDGDDSQAKSKSSQSKKKEIVRLELIDFVKYGGSRIYLPGHTSKKKSIKLAYITEIESDLSPRSKYRLKPPSTEYISHQEWLTRIRQNPEKESFTNRIFRSCKPVFISSDLDFDNFDWAQRFADNKPISYAMALTQQAEVVATKPGKYDHMPYVDYLTGLGSFLKLEKSYVVARKVKKKVSEESRVCFRSRLMPQQYRSTPKEFEKVMMKRNARAIRMVKIEDMRVGGSVK